MLPAPTANPYDQSLPTVDPTRFYGREDVIAFIRQQLIVERRAFGMALIGTRGSGKTSLLHQLGYRLDSRTLTAYIDLSQLAYAEGDNLLLPAMADAARVAFENAQISTYRLPTTPDNLPAAELEKWFAETYLDVTLSALRGGRRLAFLFDETGALLNAIERLQISAQTPAFLSNLLARDERLEMIFAVGAEDETRLDQFAPLSDPNRHQRLGYLEPEACEALCKEPVAPFYGWQDDALQAAMALGGGSPYLLQAINHQIFERSLARDHLGDVTLSDVKAILPATLREVDSLLRATWGAVSADEQRILVGLATLTEHSGRRLIRAEELTAWLARETDTVVDETGLGAALRRLEYAGRVRPHASRRYSLASGLFQQWLIVHASAPPVNLPPTSLRAGNNRTGSRRGWLPIFAVLVMGIILAAIIGRSVFGGGTVNAGGAIPASSPTVTLGVDLAATRGSIDGTNTQAAIPTATRTFTPSATITPSLTATRTPTATLSRTPTTSATFTPSATLTPSLTTTFTPSQTATPTRTFTITMTPTTTASVTFTASATSSATRTGTYTPTPTPSATFTASVTPTATATIEPFSTRILPTARR